MPAALRAVRRFSLNLLSLARILWFRALYSGLTVGKSVTLGRGVRIVVRNGARLTIGDRTTIEPNCYLVAAGRLTIGSDAFIGQGCVIAALEQVEIGPDALIAERCTIRDMDHGTAAKPYRLQPQLASPVRIGCNVWLGAGTTVLRGVSIGDNCVVGAGAVVTRSLPDNCTAVGVPARPQSASTTAR